MLNIRFNVHHLSLALQHANLLRYLAFLTPFCVKLFSCNFSSSVRGVKGHKKLKKHEMTREMSIKLLYFYTPSHQITRQHFLTSSKRKVQLNLTWMPLFLDKKMRGWYIIRKSSSNPSNICSDWQHCWRHITILTSKIPSSLMAMKNWVSGWTDLPIQSKVFDEMGLR